MRTSRTTRISLVAAGIAVGMCATLVVGTESANAATPLQLKRSNARAFVVGDSLTVGAAPYLRPYLRPHVSVVNIDAQVGRTTPQGIARLNTPVARASNIWIVGLGTNDAPSPVQTRQHVMQVLTRAGNRLVIWTNVVRSGYTPVNITLAQMDRQFANLIVIDWAKVIRSNRSLLSGDQIHLTASGYRLRAAVIAQVVNTRVN